MSIFGWCLAGQCAGTKTTRPCPKEIPQWTYETRRKKQVIVPTGEFLVCECKCHGKAKK